ncbi:MAG: flavin reductase [Gemmatimonadetes bacterium]|nr:flavin reductase [Gemmatimonadota bacterium]
MNNDAKKTALRMIPYGLYVLTAEAGDDSVAASTINWATQASFEPPLVAIGVKVDSRSHAIVSDSGRFALNVLGKDQKDLAFTFFKPHEREGDTIGGHAFERSPGGVPVLTATPAWVECRVVETLTIGDHSIVVGEVTEAAVRELPEGRADDATLWLRDLGENVFYGG